VVFSVIIGFESGFTGFLGFLSVGRWWGWCAPQLMGHLSIIQSF
jgi:hypothetical protein